MGRKPTINLNLPTGMRARRQRSGKVYYYYDIGGKPRREVPLGDDYSRAVRKWSELHLLPAPLHSLLTFKHAVDAYLLSPQFDRLADRTRQDYIRSLKFVLEFFNTPPAPLDEIRAVHVQQYMQWRSHAKVRANRERALISVIFNFARSHGMTDAANPCQGVKGFPEKGRDVYIEDAVFNALYECADRATRDAMDLAYLCGQRPGDTLRMSETDIKGGFIEVEQSKTGQKLRISVMGELKLVIERILDTKRGCKIWCRALICKDNGRPLGYWSLRERIEKARDSAKQKYPHLAEAIKNFQFRDLRAKAGTDKEDSDGLGAAQKLLGHKNRKTTEIYVRKRAGEKVTPTR